MVFDVNDNTLNIYISISSANFTDASYSYQFYELIHCQWLNFKYTHFFSCFCWIFHGFLSLYLNLAHFYIKCTTCMFGQIKSQHYHIQTNAKNNFQADLNFNFNHYDDVVAFAFKSHDFGKKIRHLWNAIDNEPDLNRLHVVRSSFNMVDKYAKLISMLNFKWKLQFVNIITSENS